MKRTGSVRRGRPGSFYIMSSIYLSIHPYSHSSAHPLPHPSSHPPSHPNPFTYMQMDVCMDMHVCIFPCIHAHMHRCTCTCMHIHAHKNYTCTQFLSLSRSVCPSLSLHTQITTRYNIILHISGYQTRKRLGCDPVLSGLAHGAGGKRLNRLNIPFISGTGKQRHPPHLIQFLSTCSALICIAYILCVL